MPRKRKSRESKSFVGSIFVGCFTAVKDAFLHLRDGCVQILEFFGIFRVPTHDRKDRAARAENRRAEAKLKSTAADRNRQEAEIRAIEQRQLKKDKSGVLHENIRRTVQSVNKGPSVSHLSRMQEKARAEKKLESRQNEEAAAHQIRTASEADTTEVRQNS